MSNQIEKTLERLETHLPYTRITAAKALGITVGALRKRESHRKVGTIVGQIVRFSEADLKELAVEQQRGRRADPKAPYHGWRGKHGAKKQQPVA